nr:MAG TPA: hypothetical protein [Bacteriophage sp.]
MGYSIIISSESLGNILVRVRSSVAFRRNEVLGCCKAD